jgi:Arc/MetJ family transcription regulator
VRTLYTTPPGGLPGESDRRSLDDDLEPLYTVHMKRTNLVLDEQLLKEVTRLSGERTYSGAVNRALLDYARRIRAGRILELTGRGLWEGSLREMRRDADRIPEKPKRKRLGSR